MNWNFLGPLIDLGGIVALIGVPYLIVSNRTKRKHFAFDFSSQAGRASENPPNHYTWTFAGTVKNRSEVPNTISQVYLVVWKNRKHNSWLRMGHGMTITDQNINENLPCPIYFKAREAKKIEAKQTITVDPNSNDGRILRDLEEVIPGKGYYMHRYQYELLFEDVDRNYFDQNGTLIDRNEADLWFTLGNSYRKLEDAQILPVVVHFSKIFAAKFRFSLTKLLWHLGLT